MSGVKAAINGLNAGNKEVIVRDITLDAAAVDEIVSAIAKHSSTITSVQLQSCGLHHDLTQKLCDVLMSCDKLSKLNLQGNLGLGADLIAPCFGRCPIREVVVCGCGIHAVGGLTMAKQIYTTPIPLVTLDISDNLLGDSACGKLVSVVGALPSLEHLNVAQNALGSKSAQAIGKALSTSTSLKYLNVSSNDLGVIGCKFILEGLVQNTSLQTLHMQQCAMLGQGGVSLLFASVVEAHPTLTTLDISHNLLDVQFATLFGTHLIQNKSLTHVDVSHNMIGDVGAEALSYSKRPELVMDIQSNNLSTNIVTSLTMYARNIKL